MTNKDIQIKKLEEEKKELTDQLELYSLVVRLVKYKKLKINFTK